MRTVKEVSRLTGISVRTLHHYDAIGLLKPAAVTESGYRLYNDEALNRLQNILLFRELQFPLKDIRDILDNPDFVPEEALEQQIHLLELKRNHLDKLISFALEIQKKGVNNVNFQPFDKTELERYSTEVKERWGSTAAYREYQEKTNKQTSAETEQAARTHYVSVCQTWRSKASAAQRRPGAEYHQRIAGIYFRALLYLHRRYPKRTWTDVRMRRSYEAKH